MKRRRFKPYIKVHKEGYAILFSLLTLLVVLNILVYLQSPAKIVVFIQLLISVTAFSFFLFFFRNPTRNVYIDDNNLVLAPADGRIVVIEPTEEFEYFGGEKRIQISIFMSVFSVHANWYPIFGTVKYIKHHDGVHRAAYLPKSSHENERTSVVIESVSKKHKILVRQIAGALARRIVTYAAVNRECHLNEHLGFIKFGSRVDIFLPMDSEIFVTMGERTKGNETIIARLSD
ncbi:MAG: phosphatidylserine decarboxylase family protein [Paludibacteraceae bacterium]|jgi:phosphatidylserine decarboxylase|nr:phosphatidylserine decarboxylase family protein [Paludibacteraceae bacterium]MDI9537422.1 phosphatidylserine decarboxylase family protein [Bacteroidota bacterium]HHT60853.1 phosphatidylserine decarboxylase family protein [Bacteroidales bacterium]MBP9039616.1 phosphatidylserine decarboxylase family protein [Paludibacteraceae bacterium]HOA46602.1 phosphatidylserine decarboxylase family protein [Paludibacteraceae bacterium]